MADWVVDFSWSCGVVGIAYRRSAAPDALLVRMEHLRSELAAAKDAVIQYPLTYGSFPAVASIAAPASSSTAVESHVPATS
jgi:hypothetical protein